MQIQRAATTLLVFDFRVHGHPRRWDGRAMNCAYGLSRAALRTRTDSAKRIAWLPALLGTASQSGPPGVVNSLPLPSRRRCEGR